MFSSDSTLWDSLKWNDREYLKHCLHSWRDWLSPVLQLCSTSDKKETRTICFSSSCLSVPLQRKQMSFYSADSFTSGPSGSQKKINISVQKPKGDIYNGKQFSAVCGSLIFISKSLTDHKSSFTYKTLKGTAPKRVQEWNLGAKIMTTPEQKSKP